MLVYAHFVEFQQSKGETFKRTKKRVENGDAEAIYNTGNCYAQGQGGYPRDYTKALISWHRAAELGYASAYLNIGYAYNNGEGVEIDKKRAKHYYELAAMKGNTSARYNLGLTEEEVDNWDRAIKHYMIAVRGGDDDSLNNIQQLYSNGHATKEDYTAALQAYQTYLDEIKCSQRDKAAAYSDSYKYY